MQDLSSKFLLWKTVC